MEKFTNKADYLRRWSQLQRKALSMDPSLMDRKVTGGRHKPIPPEGITFHGGVAVEDVDDGGVVLGTYSIDVKPEVEASAERPLTAASVRELSSAANQRRKYKRLVREKPSGPVEEGATDEREL